MFFRLCFDGGIRLPASFDIHFSTYQVIFLLRKLLYRKAVGCIALDHRSMKSKVYAIISLLCTENVFQLLSNEIILQFNSILRIYSNAHSILILDTPNILFCISEIFSWKEYCQKHWYLCMYIRRYELEAVIFLSAWTGKRHLLQLERVLVVRTFGRTLHILSLSLYDPPYAPIKKSNYKPVLSHAVNYTFFKATTTRTKNLLQMKFIL